MSLLEFQNRLNNIGVNLPLSTNIDVLKKPLPLGAKNVNNRLAIQPMEGCDGNADGSVSDLVKRRYNRFAMGGAGLIWLEATAVVNEGRANPRQLTINDNTADSLKALVENIKETSLKTNGFEPVVICQLTHSGRHSKPNGTPEPLVAYNNAVFEKDKPLDKSRIVSDDYLEVLTEKFVNASLLAEKIGFDGADIKSCHGYLLAELLSAFTRENSRYGGSFENRTRLYLDSIKGAKQACSNDFVITSRLNVYDGFEYPWGWGVSQNGGLEPCFDEPKKLINILHNEIGIELLNITIGNPYVNPHVNRPFNKGAYAQSENPLVGVERMFNCISEIKKEFPKLNLISSSHSYVGEYAPFLASGAVENGVSDIAGFGRIAIAYPNFANDILNGSFDKSKTCIACSKCSELMRAGGVAGCVIRDSEIYLEKYKEYCQK